MSDRHELVDLQPKYASAPDWIIKGGFSSRAVHLYLVLKGYARTSAAAFPGRERLAEDMGDADGPISLASVDRAARELRDRGAIRVRRRGQGKTNLYELVWERPRAESSPVTTLEVAPVTTLDASPVTTPIEKDKQGKETPPTPQREITANEGTPWPTAVGGVPVKPAERELADAILAEFNAQAGTAYSGAADHRRAIVGRLREDPSLTLDDHAAMIRAILAETWWRKKGESASPRIVYGNSGQFEQAREAMKAAQRSGQDQRARSQALDASMAETRARHEAELEASRTPAARAEAAKTRRAILGGRA